MRVNEVDRSKLAITVEQFRELIASDADWIVRSVDDLWQFRSAGGNAHARASDRDFEEFADSLEFRNGGVSTGYYRPLMASLT